MRFERAIAALRPDLLSFEEVAEKHFGCSTKTIARAVAAGRIRAVRVGRLVRIPRTEVDRVMAAGAPR